VTDVVIYTAIYGGYDRPKSVPIGIDAPCVMFTDDSEMKALALGWEVIVGDPPTHTRGMSPMMKHKWCKLHPHKVLPGIDVSMWVDGSMTILYPDYARRCLNALGDDDWSMMPHPVRDCVYTEADYSATLTWRYNARDIQHQASFYRSIGHPEKWGLFATGANVRRHNSHVQALNEHWWYENVTRTHQDQLSLPVLVRIMGDDLKWNTNLPWHMWWHLAEHEWTGGANNDHG
jgi:hypothetical protein